MFYLLGMRIDSIESKGNSHFGGDRSSTFFMDDESICKFWIK